MLKNKKFRNYTCNIALIVLSLFITASILEVSIRVFLKDKKMFGVTFELINLDLIRDAYPADYHELLGWITAPGKSGRENIWGTRVTIYEDGIRSNGNVQEIENKPLVLAVGDSFTFGDEVSDNETFPAFLEAMLGSKVLNGGVFGYGLGQITLRAESLQKKYHPDILIVGLYHADIFRCELSLSNGLPIPYFAIEDNELVLKNVPVPKIKRDKFSDKIRVILGKSYLVNFIMARLAPKYWLTGSLHEEHREHENGLEVSQKLLSRLNILAEKNNMRLIIITLYAHNALQPDDHFYVRALQYFVMANHLNRIEFIDPYEQLVVLWSNYPEIYKGFYSKNRHMSAKGNQFIAALLKQKILSK